MNQQSKIDLPSFFLSAPAPCPYLKGKHERKLFTILMGDDANDLHQSLNQSGFRRSQNIAYRPACEMCRACVSVRVEAMRYELTKSDKRILTRNKDVVAETLPAKSSDEQFALLTSYLESRHADGNMRGMSRNDYATMIEKSSVDSYVIEYRRAGELVACMLGDRMADGYSLVYSFYDPALAQDGLGNYMILHHIERAAEAGLPYVYLGYLVEKCQKMAYKKRFQPLQGLTSEGWQTYQEEDDGQ